MVTIWTYPLCTSVWNRNLWNDLLFEKHWCYLKTVTGKCFDQGTKKWRQETLHCYGQQLWFNCLPGTLMNRYILRMRGQNTRTRYLIHVELAKNTGPPDSRYERVLQLSGNRKRFPCLHSLMWTREGLGEFETVMQTRDEVEGLHNCREFSQPLKCLYQAMQTPEKRFLLLL